MSPESGFTGPAADKALTRLAVVETKMNYFEQHLEENQSTLKDIGGKVDGICQHIAKQNGTLPRLEKNVDTLLERVQSNEKTMTQNSSRTTIIWSLMSALITGGALLILKLVVKF